MSTAGTGPDRSGRRFPGALMAVITGGAVVGMVGLAVATSYTVQTAKSTVTNQATHKTATQKIVVSSTGFALYELTGDSKAHPACTKANGCFQFWPPATVAAGAHLTKGPGVPGTLGTWKRSGLVQLTLNGHPLYRYYADPTAHMASGQGVYSFGGTWHVIPATTSGGGTGGGGSPGWG